IRRAGSPSSTGTASPAGSSASARATDPPSRPRAPGYNPAVARKRSPARLVIALSVAAVLAIFLLYASFAGGTLRAVKPSQLHGTSAKVELTGIVLAPITGDSYGPKGLRFRLPHPSGACYV